MRSGEWLVKPNGVNIRDRLYLISRMIAPLGLKSPVSEGG